MMPFKLIEAEHLTIIGRKIFEYTIKKTKILKGNVFFTPVDISSVINHCPLLKDFLDRYKLTPKMFSIMQVNSDAHYFHNTIHTDEDKACIILLPVLNCEYSMTAFYDVPQEKLSRTTLIDSPDIPYNYADPNENYQLIGEFSLTAPHVIDTSVPHCIRMLENARYPRISFGIRVNEDLRDWLYS